MRASISLLGAIAVCAAALPANAAKNVSLVVCIENNNAQPLLDKAFEELAYRQMRRWAKRYAYSQVIKNCTLAKFQSALTKAAKYPTDVATLAHGSKTAFYVYGNKPVSKSQIAGLKKYNSKIRIVFQLNCWGSYLRDSWIQAGAKAVTGSRKLNTRVMAYDAFFKAWTGGKTFGQAVSDVNRARGTVQKLIDAGYKIIKRFGRSACCASKCSGNWLKRNACKVARSACRGALKLAKVNVDNACYFARDVDSTFLNRGNTRIKF